MSDFKRAVSKSWCDESEGWWIVDEDGIFVALMENEERADEYIATEAALAGYEKDANWYRIQITKYGGHLRDPLCSILIHSERGCDCGWDAVSRLTHHTNER